MQKNALYYPPGGILLWIIIYLELLTFAIALIVMAIYSKEELALFHESRLQLNTTYGTINTFFLISSGFFMAKSVEQINLMNYLKGSRFLNLTIVFGSLFLILKSVEYYEKIQAGAVLGSNHFFNFYWMLTLFHVAHVVVGLVILISMRKSLLKPNTFKIEDFKASATFWHLCDLIWLLIFPVIYLLF